MNVTKIFVSRSHFCATNCILVVKARNTIVLVTVLKTRYAAGLILCICIFITVFYSTRIPAHKVVLASCSEYFAAMFTGALRESQLTEIAIERVDAQALQSLVHYCYTGTIGMFFVILL